MPYSKMSEANPALKGINPPITLAQANAIARIADGVTGVDNPWAVAIASFKKSHTVRDGKWVRKEGSEFGKKKELSAPSIRLDVEIIGSNILQLNKEVQFELDLGLNRGVKTVTAPDGERLLVLWTANAFEDREKETFETKALEDYVARADSSGNRGRVWFWHIKGTDFADLIWQGVHGRFLLELARPDKTEYATKMMHAIDNPGEYPDLLPQGWGTSHGYLWHPAFKDGGVYQMMHKFESTVLPAHRASNIYGSVLSLGGKENMSKVTEEKKSALATLVGDEKAKEILNTTMQATQLLEEKGISFKEWLEEAVKEATPVKPTPPTVPPKKDGEEEEDEEEMDEEEDETKTEESSKEQDEVFEMELSEELMKEIATNVDVEGRVKEALETLIPPILSEMRKELVKAVKEVIVEANVSTKEEIVQQAISGKLRLNLYKASEDAGTAMSSSEKEKLLEQANEKEKKDKGDKVSQLAGAFMRGEHF